VTNNNTRYILLICNDRYPFIACEVIACEVWGIFESALTHSDMLVKFWEFLDRPPPLNPVQASYFAKVVGVFLMKKTNEVTPTGNNQNCQGRSIIDGRHKRNQFNDTNARIHSSPL
jgi:hypothetical protein